MSPIWTNVSSSSHLPGPGHHLLPNPCHWQEEAGCAQWLQTLAHGSMLAVSEGKDGDFLGRPQVSGPAYSLGHPKLNSFPDSSCSHLEIADSLPVKAAHAL